MRYKCSVFGVQHSSLLIFSLTINACCILSFLFYFPLTRDSTDHNHNNNIHMYMYYRYVRYKITPTPAFYNNRLTAV